MSSAWGQAFGLAWGNSWGLITATEEGGGIKKRKRESEYKKAFDAAKRISDERKRIEESIQAIKENPKAPITTQELSQPEIQQLAVIDNALDLQLAIEFELHRLAELWIKEKKRRNDALALLLLIN